METWKEADIPGYLVSSDGRLAKLMKLTPGPNGYIQLAAPVHRGAKQRIRRYLHDLVLTAFVGPRPPGAVVRHLNDIGTDNRVENLAWGTRSENQLDIIRNGNRPRKTVCDYGHPLEGANLRTDSHAARCKACIRAAMHARYHGVPCTQELRDAKYAAVMS